MPAFLVAPQTEPSALRGPFAVALVAAVSASFCVLAHSGTCVFPPAERHEGFFLEAMETWRAVRTLSSSAY